MCDTFYLYLGLSHQKYSYKIHVSPPNISALALWSLHVSSDLKPLVWMPHRHVSAAALLDFLLFFPLILQMDRVFPSDGLILGHMFPGEEHLHLIKARFLRFINMPENPPRASSTRCFTVLPLFPPVYTQSV